MLYYDDYLRILLCKKRKNYMNTSNNTNPYHGRIRRYLGEQPAQVYVYGIIGIVIRSKGTCNRKRPLKIERAFVAPGEFESPFPA
jgi:hypothetical protein